jgi:hypothetical protein
MIGVWEEEGRYILLHCVTPLGGGRGGTAFLEYQKCRREEKRGKRESKKMLKWHNQRTPWLSESRGVNSQCPFSMLGGQRENERKIHFAGHKNRFPYDKLVVQDKSKPVSLMYCLNPAPFLGFYSIIDTMRYFSLIVYTS